MLCNKLVMGAAKLSLQVIEILIKQVFVLSQSVIKKPKRAINHREVMDDSGSDSYFYLLNGSKDERLQFCSIHEKLVKPSFL